MPNAAHRLHSLLNDWAVPKSQAAESVRGIGDGQSIEGWRAQIEAVRLVQDVERLILMVEAGGNQADVYRRVLPKLWSAVFGLSVPWSAIHGSGATRPVLDQHGFDLLEGFGNMIDAMGIAGDVSSSEAQGLGELLTDAESLVGADADLPGPVRRYITALIREAQDALTDELALNSERARSIRLTMGGAAIVAAQHSQSRRDSWLDLSRQFLLLTMSGTAGGVITGVVLPQITGN